jgi:hypothetical protein
MSAQRGQIMMVCMDLCDTVETAYIKACGGGLSRSFKELIRSFQDSCTPIGSLCSVTGSVGTD